MKKILLFGLSLIAASSFSQTLTFQSFGTGFSSAVAIEHPANDSRLFVVQQGGLIRILNPNQTVNTTPFLNVSTLITSGGERGLLGLAFHPNYATNGLFFINYTNTSGNTVIARYSVSTTDPNVANPAGTVLMTISQPYSNHNGGSLRFGPDGYLYIGMGDGGSGGDPQGYAQNLDVNQTNVVSNPSRINLGKMLRIDVDTVFGTLNYGFPATNPYVSQAGKEAIWAYGVRNPWKFSFNRLNGDLWIADVGQGEYEEINKIASPLPNTGLNFGWRCYEGTVAYNSTGCPAVGTITMPIAQYTHTATGGCSVTGGYLYTGSAIASLVGKYVFADYCTGTLGIIGTSGTITWDYDFSGTITSFGEDRDGELYATNGGTVYKIVGTLSTTEFEKSGFSLYPNPAHGTVFVKSTADAMAAKIELYDLTGKQLLSQKANAAEENSISVADFAKGVYILTVETTTGNRYNTKLVVE